MAFLKSKRNKSVNADERFGQNVAAGFRNIMNNKSKKHLKVKMQELIFQAQFGLLPYLFYRIYHVAVSQNGPANSFQQ